jgi:hypothetical protein
MRKEKYAVATEAYLIAPARHASKYHACVVDAAATAVHHANQAALGQIVHG